MADLWPFLLLALLGAGHCAGMCGPFVVLLGGRPARALTFTLGKALTYAALAALLALATDRLTSQPEQLRAARAVCAWLAGGALILTGLAALGLRLPLPGKARLQTTLRRAGRAAGQVFDGVRRLPGYPGALGAGLAAGFLPCGLSWSALLLAASLPAHEASAAMLVFGLGTGPALLGVGVSWTWLSARGKRRLAILLGPAMIALGVFTLLRGAPAGVRATAPLPDCCAEPL